MVMIGHANKRIVELDVLRVIAIIAVVVMHCTGAVQKYYSNGVDTTFLVTNIPNALSRFAVPLFVMISGRLMINGGHGYDYFIKKSVHYMGVFLFLNFLYSLFLIEIPSGAYGNIKALLVNTVTDSLVGWFHFWFLFLICGLYAINPIIEVFVNHLSESVKRYYIIISIVFCFFAKTLVEIPVIGSLFGEHLNGFLAGFLSIYSFYFILGYWLRDVRSVSSGKLIAGLISGLICNAVIASISSIAAGERVVSFIDARSPSTLLVCVCLYLLVCRIPYKEGPWRKKIEGLSELSFGVYLIHLLVLEFFKKCFPRIGSPFAASLITVFGTLVLSFLVSWVLWRNRITRPLVR